MITGRFNLTWQYNSMIEWNNLRRIGFLASSNSYSLNKDVLASLPQQRVNRFYRVECQ